MNKEVNTPPPSPSLIKSKKKKAQKCVLCGSANNEEIIAGERGQTTTKEGKKTQRVWKSKRSEDMDRNSRNVTKARRGGRWKGQARRRPKVEYAGRAINVRLIS